MQGTAAGGVALDQVHVEIGVWACARMSWKEGVPRMQGSVGRDWRAWGATRTKQQFRRMRQGVLCWTRLDLVGMAMMGDVLVSFCATRERRSCVLARWASVLLCDSAGASGASLAGTCAI